MKEVTRLLILSSLKSCLMRYDFDRLDLQHLNTLRHEVELEINEIIKNDS